MGQSIALQRRQEIYSYLNTPVKERRLTVTELRKELHISGVRFYQIKADWEYERRAAGQEGQRYAHTRSVVQGIGDKIDDLSEDAELEEDPVAWWRKKSLTLNRAILASADKGNAQAQRLAKQLSGELVEKREDTVKFEPSTANYIEWAREVVSQLRDNWRQDSGICPVCSRPQVLLKEVRVDTEQEHGEED